MISMGVQEGLGYASLAYAKSLREFGELIHLPLSGAYLLKRKIPGTDVFDAMGTYPLCCCNDWRAAQQDFVNLSDEIISVSLVVDPYGPCTQGELENIFDVVNPFKVHYVIDLTRPIDEIGTARHRKHARAALRKMEVSVCEDPSKFVDEWNSLYQTLMQRHEITGIRAFSNNAFQQQLNMSEIVVHQATCDGQVIGAQLFFQQGDVVHCHLGAVSEQGYKWGAFYALDQFSFEYFSDKALILDIGGGAGLAGAGDDGLSRYKKGWSSGTQPVYFCGRITNMARYEQLVAERCSESTSYFPAYREGEFG